MKTGIIKAIQPDGGYDSRNGYIYRYQMTIGFPEGQMTGEIGSKSDPYPMNVGEEIFVEMKLDAKATTGKKFKKVDPKYAGQGDAIKDYRQPAQGQNSGGRDYDAENRGKCRFGILCALLTSSGQFEMDAKGKQYIDGLVEYCMTGQIVQPQAPSGDDRPF